MEVAVAPGDVVVVAGTTEESELRNARSTLVDVQVFDNLSRRLAKPSRKFRFWLIVGLALGIVGMVSLRMPGRIDDVLVCVGFLVVMYAMARHGASALRWFEARAKWMDGLDKCEVRHSPLYDKLEEALDGRKQAIALAISGESPAEQKLVLPEDYQKLVDDGTTTMEELGKLAGAIETTLGQDGNEVADRLSLPVYVVVFYREMAASIRGIERGEHLPLAERISRDLQSAPVATRGRIRA